MYPPCTTALHALLVHGKDRQVQSTTDPDMSIAERISEIQSVLAFFDFDVFVCDYSLGAVL